MSNLNTVAVSGNLTRDPELKTIPSGTSVAELGIAVNRRIKDESAEGGFREEVSFFDVTVWGRYGELVARKLNKGDSVSVQGRLQQQRWQNEVGENRSKVIIVADQLDGAGMYRSKDEDNDVQASAPAEAPAAEKPAATTPQTDDIPF